MKVKCIDTGDLGGLTEGAIYVADSISNKWVHLVDDFSNAAWYKSYRFEEVEDTNGAKKFDDGKLRMDLIPPEAIEALASVLTFGAAKYDDNNWQGIEPKRFDAAFMRHYIAWKKGELIDPESGMPHLWHMFCNIGFLIWKETHG